MRLIALIKAVFLTGFISFSMKLVIAQDTSLLSYQGADREQKILEAAQKEQTLTVYSALRPSLLRLIIDPFEKKYNIKVKSWRSGSDTVMQRVITEASGKKFDADIVMATAPHIEALYREKLLQSVYSPYQADLMAGTVPTHRQWAMAMLNFWAVAYNTDIVKKSDLPKSYQDLLDPKWKGKLGVEGKSREWYVLTTKGLGEDKASKLFKEIVAKNGVSVRQGMSLLNNLVIAGEVPMALSMYIDLPETAKKAGKPIDWISLDPVVGMAFNVSITKNSSHPNAAMLFYDYMLSPETQKVIAGVNIHPASTKVTNPYAKLNIKILDPVDAINHYDQWTKAYENDITKQAK
jgi:iron(III) transport system substrate-binding protein